MDKVTLWIRTRCLSDGGVSYDLRPARLMLDQYGQTGGSLLALILPPEWSGLTVTAVFTPKKGPQLCCLPENDNTLPLPPAVMHTGGGTLYLDGVDAAGRHLRTTAVRYEIGSAARDSGLPNIVGTIGGGAIDVCLHGPVYGKVELVKPGGF